MNKNRMHFILMGLMITPSYLVRSQAKVLKPDKPNVLFIVVDDLRPLLGCYGNTFIKSPNIDRLAKSGIVFENAYCNYPTCGPSRASLLSGIYTGINRFRGSDCSLDEAVPGIVNLPMHFRNNNYTTISLGKIYHNFNDGKGSWGKIWRPPFTTTAWDYQSKESIKIYEERNKDKLKNVLLGEEHSLPNRGPAYEKPDIPDITYMDGRIANRAMEELQNLQNSAEPFFLAVGFHKPHLPFSAPEKYWNLYDEKDINLPSNYYFSIYAPDVAKYNWPELRAYHGIPKNGPVPDSIACNLIHGYCACVSYIDAQVGLVLNQLEILGLAENTIIFLLGDHGFFLGEHSFWGKNNNFSGATHSTLIVRVPWKNTGLKTDALVEFIDIYPSLCELAGLSLPFHLQGKSFVPLIDDPDKSWKDAVFFRHGKGESILTKTHAYTEWIDYETGKSYARMLYDHQSDPEENINIAEVPENSTLIHILHKKLHDHLKERDILFIP